MNQYEKEMWSFEILHQTHEELVEVVEILGRSSEGTITFRDQKGRAQIKECPVEVGDTFSIIIIHEIQPSRTIYDNFMFQ